MDNIGDLIYIVLLAAIGIGSFINSVRKKIKESEQAEQLPRETEIREEPAQQKGFWDFMLEPQQEEEAKPQTKKKKAKPAAVRPTPFLSGEEALRPSISQTNSFMEEPDAAPILQEDAFNDPNELRKAVIYTEILQRKY